ncbi:MAG: CPBP family intramembrane metalloprotease [Gemmatimonadaceae bacterium]|nr:CPBP family intramembrane metalloprotease [Gemmatimonadaceae bacterium]
MSDAAPPALAAGPATEAPRAIGVFFTLTFAFSVPFLVAGSLTGAFLLPGLPVAALMAVCPGAAALVLAWRHGGAPEAGRLGRRAIDVRRLSPPGWWLAVAGLFPAIALVTYWLLRLAGATLPAATVTPLELGTLAAVFMASALAEEIGWTGYATDPLVTRFGVLRGAVVLGIVWAAFHVVALRQADRPVDWIAWWTLYTIATRVILVQLYAHAGRSVCAAAVLHMSQNVSWQAFPQNGSHFDLHMVAPLTAAAAIAISLAARRTTTT